MTVPAVPVSALAEGAYKSRHKKADAALIEQLLDHCEGELVKDVLHARHGTIDFRLQFIPKQQTFLLSVPCPLAGRFRVTRQHALDRWMRSFVPAQHFRSRDEHFDRDFNVQTRDLELTTALLTSQPNRAAVRRLLDRGLRAVHLAGDKVEATGPRKSLGPDPLAADILSLVDDLSQLATAVTTFAARHEVHPAPQHDPTVVACWAALAFLGLSGFAMVLAGSMQYTPVQPSRFLLLCLFFGLPTIAPVVVLLALAVQRRTSPYGLVRGLTALSIPVVPLFISGTLLLANGALDNTPAQEHVVTVVGKSAKKNKDDMRYHAGLASWWAEGEVRWVRISKATYSELEPNVSRMQVRTHPGRLGYEWLDGYSVER